ncbi:MAG TPA: adenylyltransferase/cytidyltransferase family protein [Pirellulales bacterium]|jgi:rfaE bifunctional protein nucleotidyltransferase chain/domain|nr:adenylyltransferase/cytidyltransferase family protein [Pirellulales bacterium]
MAKPRTVFTNGCFDLLHPGHVDLLERARALGDRLVVGLNSDASVQKLKGKHKPYVNETDRRRMLLALKAVDEVIIFDEDTPLELILRVEPDVLIKGGDWPVERIVGAPEVMARGGQVFSLTLLPGYSTTTVVEDIVRKVAGSDGVPGSQSGGRKP